MVDPDCGWSFPRESYFLKLLKCSDSGRAGAPKNWAYSHGFVPKCLQASGGKTLRFPIVFGDDTKTCQARIHPKSMLRSKFQVSTSHNSI